MGTWGTGIYSNDTAEDVRGICKEIYPYVSVEEGNQIIFDEYRDITCLSESEDLDDDSASFWYALADWQWKQGILNEYIKEKAIRLLKIHAGIVDWEEAGNERNVKKRIEVLNKLLIQLQSPQPACKITRKRLKKPKHKPGDIIIFQTNNDEEKWKTEDYYFHPFAFCAERLFDFNGEVPSFSACSKYMAILCIDSIKQPHSQYLQELFDENSVYVMYDYCSEIKPNLEMLKKCGFAPFIQWELQDFNSKITDYIKWAYTFTTDAVFRKNEDSGLNEINKEFSMEEVARYKRLIEKKNYLQEVAWYEELYDTYDACWEEKMYINMKGGNLDTLLNENVYNPDLLSSKELDRRWREWLEIQCISDNDIP